MPAISVDVSLDDIWFEISDAEFAQEAKRRQVEFTPTAEDLVKEALAALEDGNTETALECLRHAKNGTSPPDRKAQLADIAKGQHPFLRAR